MQANHKETIQDIYGLSPMQNSMLINHAIDPTSSAYTEQFDFRIRGDVDPIRMEWALTKLSEQYDILRTVFTYRKTDKPRQVVLKSRKPEFTFMDFRDVTDKVGSVKVFKAEDREKGFDLSKDVLLRGALLRTDDDGWNFILSFHHILMDGWSLSPLFKDLVHLYESYDSLDEVQVIPINHQYREYISWIEKQDENKAIAYWKEYLQEYKKSASIPSCNSTESYSHATHTFQLPGSLVAGLNNLARTCNLTVNTIFQTAWGILLQKYNQTDDVVFGNVVSGRPPQLAGVESMVGLFINTLPLRVTTVKGDSFLLVCNKIQKAIFESASFEYLPLYEIQSQSPLKNNLLDHIVAFENYPLSEQLRDVSPNEGKSMYFEDINTFEQTNYDFHIVINPGKNTVVTFTYNDNKYSKEIMENLERSFTAILESAYQHPELPVDQIGICSHVDMDKILNSFNEEQQSYPSNTTVDQVFRTVVANFSQNTALKWGEQTYTYEELDNWSDRIATNLRKKGLGPNVTAGLLLPRCPEMIAGILGILKTGALYVPLDYTNPKELLSFMIQDANIKVLCTLKELTNPLQDQIDHLYLDELEDTSDSQQLEAHHDITSPAYIMYTSGSTGQPKGCIITHRNILSLVFGPDFIDFGSHQVILQTGSPAFDASTFEIWGALLHGGKLVLATEEDLLDGERLMKRIESDSVHSMWLTAPLFNRLCNQDPSIFRSLKHLIVGGDVLSIPHVRKVMEANTDLQVVNGYGPTENTTFSTTHKITKLDLERERIPIGKPLINAKAYILDEGLNLLPIGAVGELVVGGEGVGLGYINRPELTAECFLDDPFLQNGRMYRTGDLARWLPDGTIDYLGRADNQVKIRGYRIELSHVEQAISTLPKLKEITVQVREIEGLKQLLAYFTADDIPDIEEWRTILSSKLPEYMVPDFFTRVDYLPLTTNGKVDRKMLPNPEITRNDTTFAPQSLSEIERAVADICADVLGLEEGAIRVTDNFFEIGVNSLNMISINNRIRERFNREVPLTVLFQYTSVARLSEYLKGLEIEGGGTKVEQEKRELSEERGTLVKTGLIIRKLEGRE